MYLFLSEYFAISIRLDVYLPFRLFVDGFGRGLRAACKSGGARLCAKFGDASEPKRLEGCGADYDGNLSGMVAMWSLSWQKQRGADLRQDVRGHLA